MSKRSVLVGRKVEREAIDAALAQCRAGSGGLVLVSGEAGVGKTRLVADALARWESRWLRGSAVVGCGSYGPLLEVLRLVRDEIDDADARRHLGSLLPEFGPPDAEIDGALLVDSLRRVFRGAAGDKPVVVVLEDLHWADAATLDLLPPLAAAIEREPVLIVATYRSDQLPRTHPLRRARTELRRGGGLIEVALRPLTEEQSGELLAGLLGGPVSTRLLAAIHSRADGLPFVVEELAATLIEARSLRERDGKLEVASDAAIPLPESVVDAVLARTADLRNAHLAAVEIAAVLGVRVDLPVLAELVAAEDIDQLLDAGLLSEETSDCAAFRHALVRDALYRSIPWARRRGHHRAIAEHLGDRGSAPEEIAEHWMAAHEHERARPLLLAAARRYCSVHAYRDAAALGRRALAIWPEGVDADGRIGALESLADCAELCGELESAVKSWAKVARLSRSAGDLKRAGSAHRRLANVAGLLGDLSRAVEAREAAIDAFVAAGARGEAAVERLALAEQLHSAAHHTRALEQAVALAEDAETAGRVDLKARSLALQGSIRASMGDGQRGVELARSGLELAITEQLDEAAGLSYYELAGALLHAADYPASANAYESAAELCRANGATGFEKACVACMSVAERFKGDWDRALAICGEVLGDDDVPRQIRMVAQEESALITALRGDRRRARGPLRRAAAFGHSNGIFGIEVGATWGLAVVADLDGDVAMALHTVSILLERCREKEDWVFALPALRWTATFLAMRGERDELAHCHRLLAAAATRNSSAKVLSALAHAGGELALVGGDVAQSCVQFGRSVELLQGITAPFEQALTQLRWGAALANADDRKTAVDTVTSAYRTARQLGAKPLAQGCAASLAEMGEQVDRRLGRLAARSLEPAGLTRREKQVLRLLSAGRTNRQIAGELFVSTRTVDMHVRNVLTKLGCTSRVAAARRGVELGIIDDVVRAKVPQ